MATETLERYKREIYEIAEAIAPTWERRRADVEEVATPVRKWMLRELRPQMGDTVLELAAGVGETGFEAAAILGEAGRLIASDLSPAPCSTPRAVGAPSSAWRTSTTESSTPSESSSTTTRSTGCSAASNTHADARSRRRLRRRVGCCARVGRLTLAVWGALERSPFFAMRWTRKGSKVRPCSMGVGIVSIQHELLDAGVTHTTSFDASAPYRDAARGEYVPRPQGACRVDPLPLKRASSVP